MTATGGQCSDHAANLRAAALAARFAGSRLAGVTRSNRLASIAGSRCWNADLFLDGLFDHPANLNVNFFLHFDRNAMRFLDRLFGWNAFPTADGVFNGFRLRDPLGVFDFLSHFFPAGFTDLASAGLFFLFPSTNFVGVLFLFFDPLANFAGAGSLFRLTDAHLNFASLFGFVTLVGCVLDFGFNDVWYPDLLSAGYRAGVAAGVA